MGCERSDGCGRWRPTGGTSKWSRSGSSECAADTPPTQLRLQRPRAWLPAAACGPLALGAPSGGCRFEAEKRSWYFAEAEAQMVAEQLSQKFNRLSPPKQVSLAVSGRHRQQLRGRRNTPAVRELVPIHAGPVASHLPPLRQGWLRPSPCLRADLTTRPVGTNPSNNPPTAVSLRRQCFGLTVAWCAAGR